MLLSIGRRPYTGGVGLADAGVTLDERGRVKTDEHYATNVPGIYAIGDVIAGPMLAHKAEEEGVALAERLAGQAGHVNYERHSRRGLHLAGGRRGRPDRGRAESRWCGLQRWQIPLHRERRARAPWRETDGFVKILADKTTDRLLGAHIIGPDAGTLIAELTTAMEFGASAEDVARTCHAHPSLSEAVKEAALAVDGRALHI